MKSKFKPYLKYKNSGIDWLGLVPSEWQISVFKGLFSPSNEKVAEDPSIDLPLSVSGYRGVEPRNVKSMEGQMPSDDITTYRIVRKGQLAVNTMWLNYTGLGVSSYNGYISPAYRSYNIKNSINKEFAHHLLRSFLYVQKYTSLLYGVRPNSLQVKTYDFERIEILLPPLETQKRIADFLDKKIKIIDELIEKKENLVSLLREKHISLITQVVARSLNSNIRLKFSDIDWLRNIPVTWEIKKIKFIAKLYTGDSISDEKKSEFSVEDGAYPYISSKDIDSNYNSIDYENGMYIPGNNEDFKIAPSGSILLCIEGGSAGKKIGYTIKDVCFVNKLCCINLKNGNNRFLYYFLKSKIFYNYFELNISGLIGGVSAERIKNFYCPCPPPTEQKKISDFLDKESLRINKSTAFIESQIEKLKEYRASLIYSVVTGKIKI